VHTGEVGGRRETQIDLEVSDASNEVGCADVPLIVIAGVHVAADDRRACKAAGS